MHNLNTLLSKCSLQVEISYQIDRMHHFQIHTVFNKYRSITIFCEISYETIRSFEIQVFMRFTRRTFYIVCCQVTFVTVAGTIFDI